MEPTVAAVLAKGQAIVEGLARLPRSARAAVPHGHFARDYNTLRKLALDLAPSFDERLLGKYVGVYKTPEGEFSQASYAEIEVYARQIVEQLALLLPSRATGPSTRVLPPDLGTAPVKSYTVAAVRKQHNQAYVPWSEEDDACLRSRFLEGATLDELVTEFGRNPGGIRSRLRMLGLEARSTPSRTQRRTGDHASVRKPNEVRFLSGRIAGVWVVVNLHKPGVYRHENAHVAGALRALADAIEREEAPLADHDMHLRMGQ